MRSAHRRTNPSCTVGTAFASAASFDEALERPVCVADAAPIVPSIPPAPSVFSFTTRSACICSRNSGFPSGSMIVIQPWSIGMPGNFGIVVARARMPATTENSTRSPPRTYATSSDSMSCSSCIGSSTRSGKSAMKTPERLVPRSSSTRFFTSGRWSIEYTFVHPTTHFSGSHRSISSPAAYTFSLVGIMGHKIFATPVSGFRSVITMMRPCLIRRAGGWSSPSAARSSSGDIFSRRRLSAISRRVSFSPGSLRLYASRGSRIGRSKTSSCQDSSFATPSVASPTMPRCQVWLISRSSSPPSCSTSRRSHVARTVAPGLR
mmetsp:Transcript_16260/g.40111  ORF Transcript_16260/g.40111 Transcript_16260/m.40111 type:complete len:320 (+) Transcript_16260:1744-2703(+)